MRDRNEPSPMRRMDNSPGYPSAQSASNRSQETMILRKEKPTFAWFVAVNGIRAGKLWPVNAQVTSIGRDAQNDIVVDDPTASNNHAKVRREPSDEDSKIEMFMLYDLVSANGTYVNGQREYRVALKDGDKIKIGESEFVYKTLEPQT